jgi:hypothetical protein
VWLANDIPTDDLPIERRAESLSAFLRAVLDLFEVGAWTWSQDANALVPVESVFASVSRPSCRP